MSELPDDERRTRYAPIAPTSEFLVGFTIFDNDDIAIFIDSVEVGQDHATYGWSVSATYSSGEATAAKIVTADPAGWSGVTVDIVGRGRPFRTSQFTDGVGVPASDQNLILNRIVAWLREAYDRTLRTLRVPPGETMAVLPSAAERAGMVLGFDSNGDPTASDLVGERGWTPQFAVVSDSARRVLQLTGYTGGEGTAPTEHVGEYVGASGYTAVIGNAVDIRGATGASGAGTGDLLAANNLDDLDNAATARTNLGLGDAATKNIGTSAGTAAAGDHTHDTRYYTEAEVDALIAGLATVYEAIGTYVGIDTKTDDYALALTDVGKLLLMNSGSSKQFSIPLNATVAWPVNKGVDFGRIGTGACTIKGVSGVTVNGVDGGTVTIAAQYGGATAIKIGTNAWYIPNATAA